jgi:uncharacterized protein YkwD
MGLAARSLTLLLVSATLCALAAGCGGGGSTTVPGPGGQQVAGSAVAQLNQYRRIGGLPAVTSDPILTQGAQQHAYYLGVNNVSLSQVGLAAHDENSSLPGYSSLGKKAGQNSVIYQGVTAIEAIDNWTLTFYHRLGMFDPNLTRVGFGSYSEYQVLDIGQGRVYGAAAEDAVVMFPFPGMQAVGAEYKREIPHPIKSDDSIGCPITVEFFGLRGRQISNVTAIVKDAGTGARLGSYLQYPGKPFLKEWDLGQLIAIIPSSPLPRGATIQVNVSAQVDGYPLDLEWQFYTQ